MAGGEGSIGGSVLKKTRFCSSFVVVNAAGPRRQAT